MSTSYDALYVGLSVIVALLASYTAMELATRAAGSQRSSTWLARLAGGSVALAMGIWSMQLIGLLALGAPVNLTLNALPALSAGALSLVSGALAFAVIGSYKHPAVRVAVGGVLLGSAMAGMHFQGLVALNGVLGVQFTWPWVSFSLALALGAAVVVSSLAYLDTTRSRPSSLRLLAALVLSGAMVSMQCQALQALEFSSALAATVTHGIENQTLAVGLVLSGIGALFGTLVLGHVSSRLARQERESRRLQKINAELALKAHTDSLTGLPNREALELHVAKTLESAKSQGKSIWLLFLDLDGFKAINDTHGHLVGDELLKAVAGRLTRAVRHTDTAFRVSGDEFVVVTDVSDSDEQVETALAQRVLSAIRAPYSVLDVQARVTVSIGLARYPDNGEDARALLLAADAAMYAAKKTGKNKVNFGSEAFALTRSRPEIIRQLERALENNELELVYQPLVHAQGRSMAGAEALLRWNHPQLGELKPGQFLPQAEAFGMSNSIGDWTLETVVRQISESQHEVPKWVNVNLAAAQIQDARLPSRVASLLRKYDVLPEQLGLEITESMSMLDAFTSIRVLKALREQGLSISMDDFGTGYSSLAQLHRLPVDKLKVDKSFIESMQHDTGALRIVEAILAMSKALGLQTVAEGVETAAQFSRMQSMGVDQMQGYGIANPSNWDQLHGFAKAWGEGRPVEIAAH